MREHDHPVLGPTYIGLDGMGANVHSSSKRSEAVFRVLCSVATMGNRLWHLSAMLVTSCPDEACRCSPSAR